MKKILIPAIASLLMTMQSSAYADTLTHVCQENIAISKDGKYEIPKECKIAKTIKITTSDVELNCNDMTIDGHGEKTRGLLIGGTKKSINNVSVRNCHFENFTKNAIRITSGIAMSKWGEDHEKNYKLAPSNIKLENCQALHSGGVGIYIDSYAHNITLDRISSINSQGVGIYLEQATKNISITNSKIIGNGSSTTRKSLREGIAIDSSANNYINNNTISSNAAGGIFLYKNCGEKISSNKSTLRWQSSDNNIISGNIFSNEKIGVWIASRQRKNLSNWDCGDKSIDSEGKYYQDHADRNIIYNNSFNGSIIGIIVESSFNIITKNTFIKTKNAISIPSRDILDKTNYTQQGNEIHDNIIDKN